MKASSGIAGVAVALSLVALLFPLASPPSRATESSLVSSENTTELMLRVTRLEAQNERLQALLEEIRAAMVGQVARQPVPDEDSKIRDLAGRLSNLEQRVALEGSDPTINEDQRQEFLRQHKFPDEVQEAIDRVLDGHTPVDERLQTLERLLGQRNGVGIEAREFAVDSMLYLARTSKYCLTRAGIWHGLLHLRSDRLRQPLLDALAYDECADARAAAAEALHDFLPDLGVEGALTRASKQDEDAVVRRNAASALIR